MSSRMTFKNKSIALLLISAIAVNAFADTIDNPCAGVLNLVDRPSNSDSACVIPFKQAMLEAGYQYQQLSNSNGQLQNFPEAELRIGLPASNELTVQLPI